MEKLKSHYCKIIFCILLILLNRQTLAQYNSSKIFSFRIEIEKKRKGGKSVPSRDTLYINFDYGYKDDIITIKTKDKNIKSDTLDADNLFGLGGHMRIAKSDLYKPIDILFNGIFIRRIRVKTRFSSVHLEFDREKKEFVWRYMRYKFSYL
jgi:hypothetical protein